MTKINVQKVTNNQETNIQAFMALDAAADADEHLLMIGSNGMASVGYDQKNEIGLDLIMQLNTLMDVSDHIDHDSLAMTAIFAMCQHIGGEFERKVMQLVNEEVARQ